MPVVSDPRLLSLRPRGSGEVGARSVGPAGLGLGFIPCVLSKDVAGISYAQPVLPLLCLPFKISPLSYATCTLKSFGEAEKKKKKARAPTPNQVNQNPAGGRDACGVFTAPRRSQRLAR